MFSTSFKRRHSVLLKVTFKLRGRDMVKSKKSVGGVETPGTAKRLKMYESSGNVFKDMGFDDALAESLLIRGSLMIEIEMVIKSKGWTQAEAARVLGVTQPRISEIM